MIVVLAASSPPALVERSEQSVPLAFNQGIARVDGGWIVSGTNSPVPGTDVLARLDDQLNVLATQPLAIPLSFRLQGYNHIGDIDVVGNVLYAPFEQSSYELGHQVTARYDASTLAFVDAVELAQHENSFVAVDPTTMTAYSMDRFDGDALLRYDVNDGWRALAPRPLTMTLQHTQGAAVADGAVWISTSDATNGVYRVDLATGDTTSVGTLGHIGAEGEGVDATALPSGRFHALVNDPTALTVHLGHYDLSDDRSAPSAEGSAETPPVDGPGASSSEVLPATGGRYAWTSALAAIFGWCAWSVARARPRDRADR